jgi:sterol desaturase/sphingolipid hydroxylase (fatty acid hydroxylase superfamily)
MHLNIIGFAIPLFVGCMLLEYCIAKKMRKQHFFNLHRSIANVSVGVAERLCDVFVAGVFYYVYDKLQHNYGLFNIQPSVALWILLFLLTDFVWYWYHRLGHEVNLLWMAHIVHHQSEDFNYTASARITVLQALARTCFWAVLPLIGFPAGMITSLLLVHGLYPFFIHTQLVGNLGVLEYILVTPSHHWVHHASNEEYLDKNYEDVLIIWDKLFGTFKKEDLAVTIQFGLTKQLKTYSFLWQHFHYVIELFLAVKNEKGIVNKLIMLFGKPNRLDPSLRNQAEAFFHIKQNPELIEEPLNKYVVWQMVVLLLSLFGFLLVEHYLSIPIKICFAFITVLTLINCGAIMEQKRWIFLVELLRFIAISFLSFYSLSFWQEKVLAIFLVLIMLITFYNSLKKNYLSYVYKSGSYAYN